MSKRPYSIKEDNLGFSAGPYMILSMEINDRIGDILRPILKDFHPYIHVALLDTYNRVLTIPKFVDASDLPIANYDPIPTWEKVVRIGIEIIDRTYKGYEPVLANALYGAIDLIGKKQKVEYYAVQQIASVPTVGTRTEDMMRLMLGYYHDIYDGGHKVGLSFYHLACDILTSRHDGKKTFDDYLRDDVSFKFRKLKELSPNAKLQHSVDWLLLGLDNHIRNAVAHKNWEFVENKEIILNDRDGWSKKFNYLEIDDILKSLLIAYYGIQAGLLISFVKYQYDIERFIPKVKHDFESIHAMLYFCADDQKFVLDDITKLDEQTLHCTLIEKPLGVGPTDVIMQNGPIIMKATLPTPAPRSERALGFIKESLSILWGYSKVIIDLKNWKKENRGILEIDLTKWFVYTERADATKEEYDNAVKRINIQDDLR
jgi:hypothetical protein